MSSENEFVDFSNSGISVSVGVDIVDIERIKRMMNRWGSRFADRCFTSYELRTCRNKTSSLASRFAAKEATYKALNTKRKGITWLDIEVRVTVLGIPSVRLYGNAADESRKQGWNSVSLSLSHDAGIAVAVVNVLKKIDFTL